MVPNEFINLITVTSTTITFDVYINNIELLSPQCSHLNYHHYIIIFFNLPMHQSQLRAVKDQRESGSIPQPAGGGGASTWGGGARGRGGRFSAPRGGGRGGRGRHGGGYYPTHSFTPRGRGE